MSFSKIFLVLKREYITRVRSKSFILSTILTPLMLVAFGALMVWITMADGSSSEKQIGIVDQTELLVEKLVELNPKRYLDLSDLDVDSVKNSVLAKNLDAYIVLDESHIENNAPIELVYGGSGGLALSSSVAGDVRSAVQEERLKRANITDEIRNIFETRPPLVTKKLTDTGQAESDRAGFMSIVGFVLGLLIFIGLFGYGSILMRSVIEEKTSRIVEIITSSIKPMELLVGKVLGVCLLGFTQFAIWMIMYVGISLAALPIASLFMQESINSLTSNDEVSMAMNEAGFDLEMLGSFTLDPMLIVYFFLFFLLGFFMYAALFAAVGSAADSEQDTQQFMPILMLPIFAGYFLNTKVMMDPDTPLAVFASLFPLTSPINMITRIAVTDVPFWEILVSLIGLLISFFGIMWISAKIYRVGILMYGKKATWGDLAKWVRQK